MKFQTLYTLSISGYNTSPVGDSMARHNGDPFSTFDNDNDLHSNNCADLFKGGWWYDQCHHSNLNGMNFNNITSPFAEGIVWFHWRQHKHSMRSVQMEVKRL